VIIQPRVVKVLVGPRAGGVAREFGAPLYIKFDITKTIGKTPNKAKVQIYGLSPASLQWIRQPDMVLQVLAGETIPGTIFHGNLITGKVVTKQSGAERITTIESKDGKHLFQSGYFSGSYPAGTTRTQILTDVLAANAVPRGYVAVLPERAYEDEQSYSAPMSAVIDELYSGELVSWSIQSGAFQLLALGQVAAGPVPVISATSGMIEAPKVTDKGVEVKYLLDGSLLPGGGFVVSSLEWSGAARITKVRLKGDSDGEEWISELLGTPLKKAA
jgi:hypothetical protein